MRSHLIEADEFCMTYSVVLRLDCDSFKAQKSVTAANSDGAGICGEKW